MTHRKPNRVAALAGAVVVAAVMLAFVASPVFAAMQQPPPAGQSQQAKPGQDEFVPVKDLPPQEQMPAAPLVIGAYAFVWAVLLVYVWSVWRRLLKVEREVHDLSSRIGERQR